MGQIGKQEQLTRIIGGLIVRSGLISQQRNNKKKKNY